MRADEISLAPPAPVDVIRISGWAWIPRPGLQMASTGIHTFNLATSGTNPQTYGLGLFSLSTTPADYNGVLFELYFFASSDYDDGTGFVGRTDLVGSVTGDGAAALLWSLTTLPTCDLLLRAAQGEPDPRPAKLAHSNAHRKDVYDGDALRAARPDDAARRLKLIEALMRRPGAPTVQGADRPGRNRLTRVVDAVLASLRRYVLPIHYALVAVGAAALFLYACVVALTSRLQTTGEGRWPDLPSPCVLALWHAGAPSLLVALMQKRPSQPVSIMVARDPRGDCLALFCRMLGLRVVRGDGAGRGWPALCELAREIRRGSCVIVTADGGGPARVAKVGAAALASATGAPLVAAGADCRPAILERHKWDRARNPVPFGRVALAVGDDRRFPPLLNAESLEQARRWSEFALDGSGGRRRFRRQQKTGPGRRQQILMT